MEQLWFTALLNRFFGGPVLSLLLALHIHPKHPDAPITNTVSMQILVVLLLTLSFLIVRSRLSVDHPGSLQHMFELVESFIGNLAHEIIGHGYERYVPYLISLALLILSCNLIGLIPGFESPTTSPVVPLGCAIVTWFYYHYHGVRTNGVGGYLKHFMGPVLWLAPGMFIIEIFSHLARLLSLTVRLYANMFAGEQVTLVFFSLVPIAAPLIFEGLHIFVALIQTYVFVLLACVYLGEATAHDH
jgi:F-type H+-transporting ATPase subunit a